MNKQDLVIAHEVMSQLPKLMREHRYRLNLSLTDVGDAVGMSSRNVAAIEHGKWSPSMRSVLVLLDWMVRSADDPPRPGESRESVTERARRANRAYWEKRDDEVQAS